MDFSEFDLKKLIPEVSAQGIDVLVQPTFGTLNVGETPDSTASVTLTTSSTSVNVGDTFEVDVKIDTKGIRIKEFQIVIDFDPVKLTVLDDQSTVSGTQIKFLDTVFEVAEGDNSVSLSSGRITLVASTPSEIAYEISNRSVARIRFQSQSSGTAIINTVTDSTGVKLINSQDRAIATPTVSRLTVSATTQADTTGGDGTDSVVPGTDSPTTGSTDGSTGQIPDTGIEDLATYFPLLLGLTMLILGIMLRNSRRKVENE